MTRQDLNNDAHMIGVPGDGGKVFITRSIRRFPQPWDPQLIADFEACPWQFGLVALFPVGGCKEDHRPSAQHTGSICCT